MTSRLGVMIATFASSVLVAQPSTPRRLASPATTTRAATPPTALAEGAAGRNPSTFRAAQLLDRRPPGVAPRIRFAWETVPGSPAYALIGRWTDAQSWAMRSQEFRVTARTATSWDDTQVTFDVSLPVGAHSWQLVALFGPNDTGDFARPSHVAFDLR